MIVGLILWFVAVFIVMFVIGAWQNANTHKPDCDNCEYASECRKRKEMGEGMREDSNK